MELSEYAPGPADTSAWEWYVEAPRLTKGPCPQWDRVPAPAALIVGAWSPRWGTDFEDVLEWDGPIGPRGATCGSGSVRALSILCGSFRKRIAVMFLDDRHAVVVEDLQEKGVPAPDAGWILSRLKP